MTDASPSLGPSASKGDADVEQIVLAGLSAGAVADLVQHMTGCALEPDDEAVEWLTNDSGGNPLLLRNLLAAVHPGYDVRSQLLAARKHLPTHLSNCVTWRLIQLPSKTRQLLGHAAALGPSFDLDALADVALRPSVLVRDALLPAVQDGVLQISTGAGRYTFAHEVVRRVLANASGPIPDIVRRPSVWASQRASEYSAAWAS